jgi:predicted dehydrogenase
MLDTAAKQGKHLMVAQVLRFFPEFALIKHLASSGDYGQIVGAHFKRVISMPQWGATDWFADVKQTGGSAIDLHIHDSDFVQYLMGKPDKVFSTGIVYPNGAVNYLVTNYIYEEKNIAISAESGSIAMQGLMFEHGYDLFFEKGTLQFDSSWGQPPVFYTEDGGKTYPESPVRDAFIGEIGYAVDCLDRGVEPDILSGQSARDSLAICLAEVRSVKTGRAVRVL